MPPEAGRASYHSAVGRQDAMLGTRCGRPQPKAAPAENRSYWRRNEPTPVRSRAPSTRSSSGSPAQSTSRRRAAQVATARSPRTPSRPAIDTRPLQQRARCALSNERHWSSVSGPAPTRREGPKPRRPRNRCVPRKAFTPVSTLCNTPHSSRRTCKESASGSSYRRGMIAVPKGGSSCHAIRTTGAAAVN